MPQNVFKVEYPKKDIPLIIICFSILGILLFFVNLIISILAFLPGIFAICADLLFYVQVNGSCIKVRTRSGRKYEFNTSDIEKVNCTIQKTIDAGSFFWFIITAKSKELCMECKMVGFDEMVRYILDKYDGGEIDKHAMTEECRNELYEYLYK